MFLIRLVVLAVCVAAFALAVELWSGFHCRAVSHAQLKPMQSFHWEAVSEIKRFVLVQF